MNAPLRVPTKTRTLLMYLLVACIGITPASQAALRFFRND
jgi:hypothetical protein